MNIRRIFVVLFAAVLTAACGRDSNFSIPTAPGAIPGENSWQGRIPWSPYMVIHNDAGALSGYQTAVRELMAHDAIRGARVGMSESEVMNNSPNIINQWLAAQGLELLVIVDNYLLFHDNLEEIMDRVIALHPGATTFQIGNEITTILPKTGRTTTIEEYMKAFRRIYDHVSVKYPNITLVSQSTISAETYGSQELEKMVGLGLIRMSPQRVIIGMNVYGGPTVAGNASVINSQLRSYRVWVTESGSLDPDRQVGHVANSYPALRNQLRAERIYWYALWAGDTGQDNGFGLIKNPYNPPLWESPLYQILTGKR
ncbi:MAG: hypothetical protein A3I26_02925 [Candidatus Yanofskybacteria bacterium RIFCSPLOWO2_02_FULL_43_10]|uniref:Uncharacterized protein n=1 Tax=Candidatus Yanofskybacteria bacterium RIFCSPLOWO2_12_FULL_43_11b TaxID=1802710 RepID=A0A1F8HA26_9BACT|nr:MAG: hypothetical protein A2742_01855 [Candidatus Yanofskybacteria bacterium RIFCSPHIGHO2_01_FULL_43_32]OGN18067.1 MAG: hypothetical protein A3E34_02220 [Candidatus Yanofskybacteria bacterium RIFCSPHIGHO2_12_FULL_43_11]OGN25348.1 MAG: hypothetical protein A2923_01645 [Candidatus Yanofskybacteria bacterium RIFCSPLOWO2_01_FULL_43_46]OGN28631.1 MAG: hypothetical protein A3I26_02925 [Candidatus Yanofskybacteria bacterium RIFCSPLOWO2_02_FULL_43_10]OGN33838.1 MAG: hypothetical protein A3G51_01870 